MAVKTKKKRAWGDRKDGRWVKAPGLQTVMAYILPKRTECEVYLSDQIDVTELVKYIELHKTADLITAPVRAGLMLAGADEEMLHAFTAYALDIGVAFQILDDILDFEGDADLIGKSVGKDKDLGKCNYVCVHGLDAAREELHRLTADARSSLSRYGADADFFTELAAMLEIRKY